MVSKISDELGLADVLLEIYASAKFHGHCYRRTQRATSHDYFQATGNLGTVAGDHLKRSYTLSKETEESGMVRVALWI